MEARRQLRGKRPAIEKPLSMNSRTSLRVHQGFLGQAAGGVTETGVGRGREAARL